MTAERETLRVVFLPMDPNGENPYQRQLADHLGDLDVEVIPAGTSAAILPKALRDWRPHVIHLHWLHPLVLSKSALASSLVMRAFMVQLRALRDGGVGVVWTAHNLRNHEGLQPEVDRQVREQVIETAHRVIVHDGAARDALDGAFGPLPANKVAVVPHGHYRDWYPNHVNRREARRVLALASDTFVFAFVGHLKPYKGVPDLVREFRALDAPNARLVIAGRPGKDLDLAELKRQVAADDRIELHARFVADDELQVFLNAADAVVFPYRQILTSGAVLLAASFGCATIAPRLADIPETLGEENAFLYDATDRDGLAGALRRAMEARDELPERGRRALQRMKSRDWPDVARRTLDVYREAMEG